MDIDKEIRRTMIVAGTIYLLGLGLFVYSTVYLVKIVSEKGLKTIVGSVWNGTEAK